MTIVRLVGGGSEEEEPQLSIAFYESISGKHADALNAALPELEKELKKRWPVKEVRLEYRLPNPSWNTLQFVIGTIEGLSIIFLTGAAVAAGPQFGKGVGKQMANIVNQWLQRYLEPPPKKATRPRKKTSK